MMPVLQAYDLGLIPFCAARERAADRQVQARCAAARRRAG